MTPNSDSGSLLVGVWPPEFEPYGRRVLATCDEMTFYELYRFGGEQEVELAPNVEQALWRSLFRINDTLDTDSWERKDRDRRVALAIALKRLRPFTVSGHRKGEGHGFVPLADALNGSLGELINWALAEGDIERAIRSAGSVFCAALRAIAREEGKIADLRTTGKRLPVVAALILTARALYADLRGKPSRDTLLYVMKGHGYRQAGNDAPGKWREIFKRAELSRWW